MIFIWVHNPLTDAALFALVLCMRFKSFQQMLIRVRKNNLFIDCEVCYVSSVQSCIQVPTSVIIPICGTCKVPAGWVILLET